jgi:hypothetical protein
VDTQIAAARLPIAQGCQHSDRQVGGALPCPPLLLTHPPTHPPSLRRISAAACRMPVACGGPPSLPPLLLLPLLRVAVCMRVLMFIIG